MASCTSASGPRTCGTGTGRTSTTTGGNTRVFGRTTSATVRHAALVRTSTLSDSLLPTHTRRGQAVDARRRALRRRVGGRCEAREGHRLPCDSGDHPWRLDSRRPPQPCGLHVCAGQPVERGYCLNERCAFARSIALWAGLGWVLNEAEFDTSNYTQTQFSLVKLS
eukprot:SAG11_NODE_88_length_17244_cov_17.187460_7_plen_166_part_00